jgi:hypothetical protein
MPYVFWDLDSGDVGVFIKGKRAISAVATFQG